ncbi:hypothetical protein ACJIZ3_023952 [Penstemon smallii]|uniref:Late embryogenesis abundant protein LEA-2 subgroup domain-containing protein n=1 Tax=Penstemon smallii TaxID=265156 RepID=A0ABD3TQG6_9LAMI
MNTNNNDDIKDYSKPKPPVVGYPSSIDPYPQSQNMFPHGSSAYPVPMHPPHGAYASQSFQHHPGYGPSSSFHAHGKYPASAAQINPYSPSFNQYYYQQQPYKPLMLETNPGANSFGRMMLILMIVLVGSMCMMSLVMWFLFGTYIPEFQVVSLKVSNFSSTNTTLTGIWDAKLTVRNTNEETVIQFDRVRSSIYYGDVMLGISTLRPFEVEKKKRYDIDVNVTAEHTLNVDKMQSSILPTLAEDRSNGVVVFSLRLSSPMGL